MTRRQDSPAPGRSPGLGAYTRAVINVPIWPAFVRPILVCLNDDQVHDRRNIYAACYSTLGLGEQALGETLPSGESRAKNRASWALSDLTAAGWITRVSRGRYQIADSGREWLRANPLGFSDYTTARQVLVGGRAFDAPTPKPSLIPESPLTLDPIEQIEAAITELDGAIASDLLGRLRTTDATGAFFEEAVVEVLLAMGYGGTERQGRAIGRSGDGGVDGVIDQDALGLDQIYVQAKRYAKGNNVSGQDIQAFVGAVLQKGASRGVFLTTSDFTTAAWTAAAASHHVRIVLINGERLAALMIKHRVGVQVKRTYDVVEVDDDFFE